MPTPPTDSCTLALARYIYQFKTQDGTRREQRLAEGKPNVGASRMITESFSLDVNAQNRNDNTIANRKTEEYYNGVHSDTSGGGKGTTMNTSENFSVQIPATRLVSIPGKKLSKLGIVPISSGVCMYRTENFGQIDQYFQYFGMTGTITMNTCRFDKLNANGAYPAMTTDDMGAVRSLTYNTDKVDAALAREVDSLPFGSQARLRMERKLSEEARIATMKAINTFVPVLVQTGRAYTAHDSALGLSRPDMIFWYEPTPQLLALLPDTLHDELITELARVDSTMHRVDSSLGYIDKFHRSCSTQKIPAPASSLLSMFPTIARGECFSISRARFPAL